MAIDNGLTPEELAAEPRGGHKFSSLGKGPPMEEEAAYKLAKESAIVAGINDAEYINAVKQELMTTGESKTADSRQAVVDFGDDDLGNPMDALGDTESGLLDDLAGSTATASEAAVKKSAKDLFILRRLQDPTEDVSSLWDRTEADVRAGGDVKSLITSELIRYGENEHTQALNLAMEGVKQGDEEALLFAEDLLRNPSAYSEYYAEDNTVVNAVASTAPFSYPDFKRRDAAANAEIYNTMSEWAEGRDVFDKVVDIAALIFVPDTAVDLNDLMKSGLVDSVPDFYTDLKKFHYTLTPEERVAEFKVIFPKIVEAFDNNEYKIAAITSMFLDRDLGASATAIGSTFLFESFVAFDALQVVKALNNMKKAGNIADTYKKAGRVDEAARAVVVASADDGAGAAENAVGMSRGEAAASTSPVDYEQVIPNSIDGVAARVSEIKKQAVGEIKDDLVGWAANKMPREEEKTLRAVKRELSMERAKLKAELDANPASAGGTAKSRAKIAEGRAIVKEQLDEVEARLGRIDDQLKLNNNYATAEAELSRMQQGIYSPAIKARIDEAVEAELNALRQQAAERATGGAPRTAPAREPLQKGPEGVSQGDEAVSNSGVVGTQGLSQEFIDELNGAVVGPMRNIVDNILTPTNIDDPAVRAAAVRRVEEKLQAEVQSAGSEFSGARVTEMNNRGFKMEYEVDGTGEVYEHVWTRNDAGSWVSETTNPDEIRKWTNSGLGRYIFSPAVLLERLNAGLVDTITFSGQQAARIRNELGRVWKEAEEGLKAKDIELVDNLLWVGDEWVEGDKVGKVFTPMELMSGIETRVGTIALDGMDNSQDIMRAYYKKRAFYDELHRIRDVMTRRNLEVKGFKNLDYVEDGVQKQAVVKPLEKWEFPDQKDLDYVIDLSSGTGIKGSLNQVRYLKQRASDFKEAGYQVVELFEPRKVGRGKNATEIKYGIVKQGDDVKVGGLPSRVLNYSPGYVPRIYERGLYYVKNAASEHNETLYAFRSREEANKYVEQIKREQAEFVGPRNDELLDPVIREDRALNQNELLREQSVGYGGLYTGSRKKTPLMIKEGEDTFRPERLSTSQATERYLLNMSEAMPLNEFKEFAMQEWINTVNKVAEISNSGKGVRSFNDPIDVDSRYAVVLEQARDYLMKSLNIPTKEERLTHTWMMGMANLVEGKPFLGKTRGWFIDHADTDITRQMKAYTFDLTMGWFNARQLFVQAQNASLAASMYPKHALGAFGDTVKMRALVHMPEHQLRPAAKKLGYDDDMIQNILDFKASGLEDSIIRTADFNPVKAGIGHSSLRAFSKAAKTGRVFYEEGELAARMMSWNIARRKLGKGASVEDVSKESVRMHMNMQAENAAWWQNAPVIGMATQFLQVQAKFIENVMPQILGGSGKWTAREKAHALAGQLALYGTSGVLIAEGASAFLAELNGQSIDEWERENPNVAEAVQEGFVGSMLSLFGAKDINATEAVSLVAGLDDNVISDIITAAIEINNSGFNQGVDLTEVTFGPTLSSLKRGGDLAAGMMRTAMSLTRDVDDEVFMGMLMENVNQLASLTSSWNNIQKMKLLQRAELILGRDGQKIATARDLGDLNPLEHAFVAMGFSTDAEVAHYRQKDFLRTVKQERTDLRKGLLKAYKDYARHKDQSLYAFQRAALLRSSGLSRSEILDVEKNAIRSILGPSSIDTQTKLFINELIKTGGRLDVAPGQSQLIQGESE